MVEHSEASPSAGLGALCSLLTRWGVTLAISLLLPTVAGSALANGVSVASLRGPVPTALGSSLERLGGLLSADARVTAAFRTALSRGDTTQAARVLDRNELVPLGRRQTLAFSLGQAYLDQDNTALAALYWLRAPGAEHLVVSRAWLALLAGDADEAAVYTDMLGRWPSRAADRAFLDCASRSLTGSGAMGASCYGQSLVLAATGYELSVPGAPSILYDFGVTAAANRDWRAAEMAMLEVVELVHDPGNALMRLGFVYLDGYRDPERAIDAFEASLESGERYWTRVGLSRSYALLGDSERAARECLLAAGHSCNAVTIRECTSLIGAVPADSIRETMAAELLAACPAPNEQSPTEPTD